MLRRALLSIVSHRTAALLRWDMHFLGIRARAVLSGVRARIARQLASSERPIYMNLGSGPRGIRSSHWLNVDGYRDRNVEHLIDISRALPIEREVLDGIFSEHVQEHFDLASGIGLLRECHRVLRPGGWIRVIMPDAEWIARTYLNNPETLLTHRPVESHQPMDAVNSYFRQRYEHQCLYDFELAKFALEEAGFVQVDRVECGAGRCPPDLILDDPKYSGESLYVEAVKPAEMQRIDSKQQADSRG